jgi:hypothetical protein
VEAVAPGGTLLIVGHSLKDLEAGARRPPAERIFDEAELRAAIPGSWRHTVAFHAREQATSEGQTVVVHDIVAVAVR